MKKEYISHIKTKFHAPIQERLPKLLFFADKVENVHAQNAECPRGLTSALQNFSISLSKHIKNEEENLFPFLLTNEQINEENHKNTISDHEALTSHLESIKHITNDFELPPNACGTWTFLYQQLDILEKEMKTYLSYEKDNILN